MLIEGGQLKTSRRERITASFLVMSKGWEQLLSDFCFSTLLLVYILFCLSCLVAHCVVPLSFPLLYLQWLL